MKKRKWIKVSCYQADGRGEGDRKQFCVWNVPRRLKCDKDPGFMKYQLCLFLPFFPPVHLSPRALMFQVWFPPHAGFTYRHRWKKEKERRKSNIYMHSDIYFHMKCCFEESKSNWFVESDEMGNDVWLWKWGPVYSAIRHFFLKWITGWVCVCVCMCVHARVHARVSVCVCVCVCVVSLLLFLPYSESLSQNLKCVETDWMGLLVPYHNYLLLIGLL